MKAKIISLMALVSLLLATYAVFPVASPVPPDKPTELLIRMYLNPDLEFGALETGEIDVVDWPLPKDWIDRWLEPGYEDIRMVDYSEMAWNELTPNSQLWPTGWRNYTENPTIPLGGHIEQYDPDVQRHVDALHFRTAIAYLNDKERYITDVLKGFGVRTDASKPATVGWISPNIIKWPFSVELAEAELTAGAFIDYDDDNWLEYSPSHATYVPGSPPADMEELPPLEFWSRLDDPNRGDSADILQADLQSVGIPVNYHKEDAWSCYLHVMFGAAPGEALPANWPDISHWYPSTEWLEGIKRSHLYTSGWIATSPTQDQYHDLYVEAMATEGEMMFSTNYGGFYVGDGTGTDPDTDYEYWADVAKFGTSEAEVKAGVFKCQEMAQEYFPVYPWHSLVSVKAYRHNEGPDETFEWDYDAAKDDTGWYGMVNHANLGPDFAASNAFSFVNCYNPDDSVLDWGFKTEPFTLNVVTAQWLYESNVLNLIYEPLILHTPWELTNQYPWLAEPMGPGPDGEFGSSTNPAAYYDDEWAEFETWYDPDGTPATGDERMAVTMRLRDDIYFTNGTSDVQNHQVTPEDIKFNCLFQRDSGPGVSYGWPTYALMEYVDIQADDPSLGPKDIKFYFGIGSFWLLYYAGYVGPLNMDLWMAANNNRGWGYRWPRGSGYIEESWDDGGKTFVRTSAHPGNPCEIAIDESAYIVYDPEAPDVHAGPFNVDDKYADGDTYVFELNTTVLAQEGDRLEEFPGDGSGWSPEPPGGVDGYHPWEHDEDGSGLIDLAEDGTGSWVFSSWDVGNTILLDRNPEYHKVQSSDEIRDYLIEAFHRAGNVNYEGAVYESTYTAIGKPPDVAIRMTISPDGVYLARSVGTDDTYPLGTDFMEFNEDCDFNRDGEVWLVDYILRFGMNYGKDAG